MWSKLVLCMLCRDSMDLVVTLALRFLSMAGSLSAKLVRDLYQGVCLLLLGV
jgi:hypothetical protein